MKYYIEQRSREWHQLRLGRVTSTRLKTVAHGTLAAQTKLLEQMQFEVEKPKVALEIALEGFGYATPSSIALGREREDWMLARYEIRHQKLYGTKLDIDLPGFVTHPSIDEFGCSPDWLIPDKVGEGKTRVDESKHEYAIKRGLLPEDKDQIYCHGMVCGKMKADYVSYCPEYEDEDARLIVVEVELDQIYINFLYAELNRFLGHFRAGTRPTKPVIKSGVPSFFD